MWDQGWQGWKWSQKMELHKEHQGSRGAEGNWGVGLCSNGGASSWGEAGGRDFGAAMLVWGVTMCDWERAGPLWHDRPWQRRPVQHCSGAEQEPHSQGLWLFRWLKSDERNPSMRLLAYISKINKVLALEWAQRSWEVNPECSWAAFNLAEKQQTHLAFPRVWGWSQLSEACVIISGQRKEGGGRIVLASSLPCDD